MVRIPEDVAAGLVQLEQAREDVSQGIDGQLRNKDNYTYNTGQDSVIYHEAIQSADGCEKEKAGRNNDKICPLGNDR